MIEKFRERGYWKFGEAADSGLFEFLNEAFHSGKRLDESLRSHDEFAGDFMRRGRLRIAVRGQENIEELHADHSIGQTDGFHTVHKNTFAFHSCKFLKVEAKFYYIYIAYFSRNV